MKRLSIVIVMIAAILLSGCAQAPANVDPTAPPEPKQVTVAPIHTTPPPDPTPSIPVNTPESEKVTASPICTTPPPESVDLPDFDSVKTEVDAYIQDFEGYRDRCETKEVYYDVSTEGGTVTGYYMGDALKYMEVWIYGEMFRCRYDIYYVSESLSYLVETFIKYDMPYYMEGFTEEETISGFIIFDHEVFAYADSLYPADEETADDYKVLIKDFERSLREPVSKDEIIGMFNENYTVFASIVDYAGKTRGRLRVYYYRNTREIISNSKAEIDEKVFDSIEVLLNDLYFCEISEVSRTEIHFMRYTHGQGICYSNKPLDPESYDEIEEIRNGWYYYYRSY